MQNDPLRREANNVKSKAFLILLVLLLAGNIFFGIQYFALQKQLRETQAQLSVQRINERTLAFTKLFVEKVLQSEQEVDFETRLLLENAVRGIGDEEIVAQWKRFTESKTEEQAQREVQTLLGLLAGKIEM